jgi:hypothetical protein
VLQYNRGQIRKNIANHNRIFLTQLILRIKNIKAKQDMIKNRINISYPIGTSNRRYKYDMIDLSYPVFLS